MGTLDCIRQYKYMPYKDMTKVYSVVKYKHTVVAPSLLDTFFYTLPVRHRKHGYHNCVLAVLCKEHARIICDEIQNGNSLANHNENMASDCKVNEYTLGDLSFYAYNLGMPLVLVSNSYCEGRTREPFYEIMLVDEPFEK